MNKEKLDFSEFHPLDHWPWEKVCRELPKAKFRTPQGYHLHVAWRYRHRDNISYYAHKYLLCKLGKHDAREFWYYRDKKHGMRCMGCGKITEILPWGDDPLGRRGTKDSSNDA